MKGKREGFQGGAREDKRSPRRTAPVGDPFAEDSGKPGLKDRWAAYWDSGKGKILVAVLSCLAVFAIVVTVALKMWIKPPELPVQPAQENKPPQQQTADPSRQPGNEEPGGPTDDELYPDDGYNGDMPTVSGNRKDGWYTFLLVGTDMDDGNTDTIMVVSYDTKKQDINIMSIPRDTMINEKWDIKKINSVYSRTGNSVNSLSNRVQKLIGFKPDFYVKVDLEMFVKLVDLVDGVEFDVPQDMNYDDDWQDLHIHLKKGVQVLDGEHAMQLVRFRRYDMGDIQRVEVQQSFLKALIKECLSIKHWGKIKAYIDLAMENVETDLDSGSVVWFAANVLGLNGVPALSMDHVETCTLPGNYLAETWSRDTRQNQSYVTIYPNQVVKVVNESFNPYEQKVTTDMLDVMSILPNGDIASSTGSLRDTQHNDIMAVRRGEAYYDDDGNVVYGQPPAKPEQDEQGNWYIIDEDGTITYTDENGEPLTGEPLLPENGSRPVHLPAHPTDGNQSGGNDPTPGVNPNPNPNPDPTPGTEVSDGEQETQEEEEGEEPLLPEDEDNSVKPDGV